MLALKTGIDQIPEFVIAGEKWKGETYFSPGFSEFGKGQFFGKSHCLG